jgi:hypothetical protein
LTPLPDSVFYPERPSQRPPETPDGQPRQRRSLRPRSDWVGWTSPSWALYALAALVLAGVVLRVLASAAVWPTLPSLADSWPYAYYAGTDVFANPQHPAGYSIFLGLLGVLTHSVAAFVVLQHLIGIASALILFAAVRRLCGSPWPGVVGAAVILLGADQLYLEDLIMSEVLFTLLIVCAVYAIARAVEQPQEWWPWPAVAGGIVVLAAVTRTAGLFMIPVFLLALLLARPRPWLPRWRPLIACLGSACVLLLCYAIANSNDHGSFGITPSPGWRLYSRVAPFADCGKFTPPEGTEPLCERKAPADRFGSGWYLLDAKSPGSKLYGQLGVAHGAGDAQLGAFARQVILHQPGAYLEAILPEMWAYFFPGSYGPWKLGRGTDIDGQLSWHYGNVASRAVQRATQEGMESFFSPFSVHVNHGLVDSFYDYQRVFRFGATLLVIATLLILLGLFVGPRRNRIAVVVLGISGLAIIVLPIFSSEYIGRYMVPPAGLLAAAAAVTVLSLTGSSIIRQRTRRLPVAASPSNS